MMQEATDGNPKAIQLHITGHHKHQERCITAKYFYNQKHKHDFHKQHYDLLSNVNNFKHNNEQQQKMEGLKRDIESKKQLLEFKQITSATHTHTG